MKLKPVIGLTLVLGLVFLVMQKAQADSTTDFSFDNFAGTYNLGRDSNGVATLEVEEDMTVVFPANGTLYGIQRALPTSYQGHNLNLGIISLTDAIGNPVDYKTSTDSQGNEVVTTGDPSIILSGVQTYKLNYHTTGVASINSNDDEFLVDVNGRGWQESFDSVKAFINVPKDFATNLTSQSCYVGYNNKTYNFCTLKVTNKDGGKFVEAVTNGELTAHQALVVKLDFKTGTFNQIKPAKTGLIIAGIGGAVICLGIGGFLAAKFLKKQKP